MSTISPRTFNPRTPWRGRMSAAGLVASVMACVISGASFAGADGGIAANGAKPSAAADPVAAPISLAGRWKGPRYGYNFRGRGAESCAGQRCELTYDIVACGDAWCGIAVSDDATCGRVALRLGADAKPARGHVFNGKLELAAGAAPYTVQAWYAAPEGAPVGVAAVAAAADGAPGRPSTARLSFVGDTGDGGMLMMRRSFPFQAELQRIADATCTLEKATS